MDAEFLGEVDLVWVDDKCSESGPLGAGLTQACVSVGVRECLALAVKLGDTVYVRYADSPQEVAATVVYARDQTCSGNSLLFVGLVGEGVGQSPNGGVGARERERGTIRVDLYARPQDPDSPQHAAYVRLSVVDANTDADSHSAARDLAESRAAIERALTMHAECVLREGEILDVCVFAHVWRLRVDNIQTDNSSPDENTSGIGACGVDSNTRIELTAHKPSTHTHAHESKHNSNDVARAWSVRAGAALRGRDVVLRSIAEGIVGGGGMLITGTSGTHTHTHTAVYVHVSEHGA
jgi:hypothetical protein